MMPKKTLKTILQKEAQELAKQRKARFLYFECYNENLLIYKKALYIFEKESDSYLRIGAYPPKENDFDKEMFVRNYNWGLKNENLSNLIGKTP